MEDWLTKALDKAAAKGLEEGMEKGIEKGMKAGMDKGMAGRLVRNVDSLMKNEGYSMERACRSLDSTVEEYEEAKKILSGVAFAV